MLNRVFKKEQFTSIIKLCSFIKNYGFIVSKCKSHLKNCIVDHYLHKLLSIKQPSTVSHINLKSINMWI